MSFKTIPTLLELFRRYEPNQSKYQSMQASEEKNLLDPKFPVIISPQRSGRHWIQAVMECYLQEPFLPFDTPWSSNDGYTEKLLHMHGFADRFPFGENYVLGFRKDVVAVVFSLAWHEWAHNYHPEVTYDSKRAVYYSGKGFAKDHADYYGWFLNEYLLNHEPKFVYTFESMKTDMRNIVQNICKIADIPFIEEDFRRVEKEVTREKITELCGEAQVMDNASYREDRNRYREEFAGLIYQTIEDKYPQVLPFLEKYLD